MALISKTGIINGNAIQSEHITRIIDALNESGSATIIATGSFTGSFKGDGSQITGVTGEWDGSLNGNASITGSLNVTAGITGSFTGSIKGDGSQLTGVVSSSYAVSASYATNANAAISSLSSVTSGTAVSATSASYAVTASYALSANIATGAFGISNASGSYTYYTTLSGSMAAASSGQTIEMFADVTEAGAVTVLIKPNVILQGNGHRYKHTSADSTDTFSFGTNADHFIYNLHIERTNATGGYVITRVPYVPFNLYGNGSTISTNSNGFLFHFSQPGNVYNITLIMNGSGVGFVGSGTNYSNCVAIGTSTFTGNLASSGAVINNCSLINRGSGVTVGDVFINSSTVNSYASAAANGCYGVKNSWLYSATSYALLPFNNFTVENSVIQSAGSYAAYIYNANCRFDNCTLISSAGNAFYSGLGGDVKLNNCVLKSTSAVALNAHSVEATNCTIDSTWNNSAGHAVAVVSNDTVITNSTLRVANISASAIYGASAYTPKYAGNIYIGMTTPVHANITQGITNTQDNYGNILI